MNSTSVCGRPQGSLEVVVSFDTTGSMCKWLDELRGRIQDMIQRLQADIPGIRMAVFAHGDYCDVSLNVTKWVDLTCDIAKLCDFVKNVEQTGGGNAPACYELVLRQVRQELSWTPGSRRVLVLIGDNNPNEPHEPYNKNNINWKEEVAALAKEAVTIYGVQCGKNSEADQFYKTISLATGGKHLRLEDFGSLFDTLMAVCYREGNDTAMLGNYEKEVRARCLGGAIAPDIDAIFASLKNDNVDSSIPVPVTLAETSIPLPVKPMRRCLPFPLKKFPSCPPMHFKPMASCPPVSVKLLKTELPAIESAKRPDGKKLFKARNDFNKFKVCNLPLLKRENVPEKNFNLRSVNWSRWTLAMVSDQDLPEKNINKWEKRHSRPGYRLKKLPSPNSSLNGNMHRPALFEVAVQGSGARKKRYVVFFGFSSLCVELENWERRLLRHNRSQVDGILRTGGRVFVRFWFVEKQTPSETRRKYISRYDYPWKMHRHVVKGDTVISDC